MYQFLTTHRDGAIAHVTLNRPEVRNAFNAGLIRELTHWAEAAAADRTIRVAVLAGAGPVFSAGADLSWMSETVTLSHEENLRDATAAARLFFALDSLPMLLIGRIHGAAFGGGAGLAAVCDVAVAEETTQFGFTEVKLGIIPAVISPYCVAKIGRSAARELFLTGVRFDARRAHAIGLVHAVAPASDLDAVVAGYAKEALTGGPAAIAAAKALIGGVWNRPPADVMTETAEAIATRRVSAEGQEGLRAFLEKRKASWNVSTDPDR